MVSIPWAMASVVLLIVDPLAADEDVAAGERHGAGQDLDERRLAGAVVAQQARRSHCSPTLKVTSSSACDSTI